jgi:acetate---CoA ligase (ADP-forming) subunit beta
MDLIDKAVKDRRNVLSEFESKQILADYGIPVTREILVQDRSDVLAAAKEIGFPLVMKGFSHDVSHKTEQGLITLDIRDATEAEAAYDETTAKMDSASVLVQEMIRGDRELMVGLTRDPQFGPSVMFGLGGIFTEVLRDVSFRIAPLSKRDALEMMTDIRAKKILGPIRGLESVDLDSMADILMKIGSIGLENAQIKEIDVNPLIVRGVSPVAVDALVVLDSPDTDN